MREGEVGGKPVEPGVLVVPVVCVSWSAWLVRWVGRGLRGGGGKGWFVEVSEGEEGVCLWVCKGVDRTRWMLTCVYVYISAYMHVSAGGWVNVCVQYFCDVNGCVEMGDRRTGDRLG